MRLDKLTTTEVDEYLKNKRTIILPFGSIEQHGPHLPCGTDTFIAEKISIAAAEKSEIIVAPVIPIGFSPGLHPQMKGTISVSGLTYITLIKEILLNLSKSGFTDFLCITGHGMNFSPLKTAVMDYFNDNNGRALVLGYWEIEEVKNEKEKLNDDNGVHCTIMETSMMLYLMPELVDMSKSFDEYTKTDFLLGKAEIRKISKSGIIANTTKSSAEKGKIYFNAAVNGMIRMIKKFEN